jgi:hypothetical protein
LTNDKVVHGVGYCKVTSTAASAFGIATELIDVSAGTGYYVAAAIRPVDALAYGTYKLRLNWYDEANAFLYYKETSVNLQRHDRVAHLQIVAPGSKTLSVVSISVTSGVATATAAAPHGLSPSEVITLGAITGTAGTFPANIGGGSYTITYRVDGLTVATSTTVLTGINCDGRSFTCKINDIGPGGGKVFYVSSGNFTQTDATGSMCSSTCKYLEVAPDFQTQLQWTGLPYEPTLIGTSDGIGTGYSNTLKIVGQSQAASAARNYTGNGLNDWFLPSNSELAEIAGFNSIFGGFLAGRAYWSSTEFDATRSRYYVFNSFGGIQTKQSYYYVLAIRAF